MDEEMLLHRTRGTQRERVTQSPRSRECTLRVVWDSLLSWSSPWHMEGIQ